MERGVKRGKEGDVPAWLLLILAGRLSRYGFEPSQDIFGN